MEICDVCVLESGVSSRQKSAGRSFCVSWPGSRVSAGLSGVTTGCASAGEVTSAGFVASAGVTVAGETASAGTVASAFSVPAAADYDGLVCERPFKFTDIFPSPDSMYVKSITFKEILGYWGYRLLRR